MKNIKSISTCCLSLGVALFFSFSAMAAVITAPGGTIPDATGAGPDLAVKLSPGVNLNYLLDTASTAKGTTFAINTQNANVAFDTATGAIQTRNEYGIASDYAGYFMRPAIADALAAPTTAANSSAFPITGTNKWTKQ